MQGKLSKELLARIEQAKEDQLKLETELLSIEMWIDKCMTSIDSSNDKLHDIKAKMALRQTEKQSNEIIPIIENEEKPADVDTGNIDITLERLRKLKQALDSEEYGL
ncbi:MAG: hypothetical protein HQL29_01765 [Candidatus Omnitrophica bacterium]|nr:hypothetical protein [Candidatus Omnitrophota bacterium]